MNKNRLLIHDLQPGFAADGYYDTIIEDNGNIKNCIGCFSCWIKTPMECVLKDGYEHMAEKLAACDELTIVSRCTYGGPSAYVKNVLDRSIPYLHPNFVIKNGEMHHKQRFPQHFSIKVLLYGDDLTANEKETAEAWAKAMALNLDAVTVETMFYGTVAEIERSFGIEPKAVVKNMQPERSLPQTAETGTNIALISGSPKKNYNTSGKLLEELQSFCSAEKQTVQLHWNKTAFDDQSMQIITDAETLVISFPLYVDGIPSHFLRCLNEVEAGFRDKGAPKSVYTIINCGFYEGEQTETAMKMVENWCKRCGFTFGGGLGVGAGGMWHSIKDVPPGHGPKKTYGKHQSELAQKIEQQAEYGCIFTTVDFPRFAYKMAGESGWKKTAKRNGITL